MRPNSNGDRSMRKSHPKKQNSQQKVQINQEKHVEEDDPFEDFVDPVHRRTSDSSFRSNRNTSMEQSDENGESEDAISQEDTESSKKPSLDTKYRFRKRNAPSQFDFSKDLDDDSISTQKEAGERKGNGKDKNSSDEDIVFGDSGDSADEDEEMKSKNNQEEAESEDSQHEHPKEGKKASASKSKKLKSPTSSRRQSNHKRKSVRSKQLVHRFNPFDDSRHRTKTNRPFTHFPRNFPRYADSESSDSDGDIASQTDLRSPYKNAIRPLNSSKNEHAKVKDRADVDPMTLDPSINFDSVGGLDQHVKALKEMITFPLLYPEIFAKFNMAPPKGVLFYGPPGTGKTLVARALANTCSQSGHKVSFFMRKGADCLTKWVGEAERQLRLLFQQAHDMQPSIIFFDEIDGLAPVRSSRQDQIHSSIVSTLLALMDGLDSRGQVVVIGATNRIDSIDPALRRPGRFDREFLFTLPTKEARRDILGIHTKEWKPPLNEELKASIADNCVGYCGADLKALCSEAALVSLRRVFPQIYESTDKLLIDVNAVEVSQRDFLLAMKKITPASHRSSVTHAKRVSPLLSPLLDPLLQSLKDKIGGIFPFITRSEEDEVEIMHEINSTMMNRAPVYRPRILIHGKPGNGQTNLSAAILHYLEEFPVSSLDIASLYTNPSTKSIEESFVVSFKEALRKLPSIIYLPHIDTWWQVASNTLRLSLINMIQDLDASLPLFIIGVSDSPLENLHQDLKSLFGGNTFRLDSPDKARRAAFFNSFLDDVRQVKSEARRKPKKMKKLEKAPIVEAVIPQQKIIVDASQEEEVLLKLRMFLRKILGWIYRERKYQIFFKAVDPIEFSDYYEIVKTPLDLSVVLDKVDDGAYTNITTFIDDIQLVVDNCIKYNPVNDNMRLTNTAKGLQDSFSSKLKNFNPDILAICEQITLARANDPKKTNEHYIFRRYTNLEKAIQFASKTAPSKETNVENGQDNQNRNSDDENGHYQSDSHAQNEQVLHSKRKNDDQVTDKSKNKKRKLEDESSSQAKIADDDIPCEICGEKEDAAEMLLCDRCDHGYHIYCLDPPLSAIPSSEWFCVQCVKKEKEGKKKEMEQENLEVYPSSADERSERKKEEATQSQQKDPEDQKFMDEDEPMITTQDHPISGTMDDLPGEPGSSRDNEDEESEVEEMVDTRIVEIDLIKAKQIHQNLISNTNGNTIENIILARSKIYGIIFKFRSEYKKDEMLKELELLVKEMLK